MKMKSTENHIYLLEIHQVEKQFFNILRNTAGCPDKCESCNHDLTCIACFDNFYRNK
jgi:hypothetical protein